MESLRHLSGVLFGTGEDLAVLHVCARALLLFTVALVWVRIAGRRTFGRQSAFDVAILIMLGSVLARAIIGASPLGSAIAGGLVLAVAHRVLMSLTVWWSGLERAVKGPRRLLYRDGTYRMGEMAAAGMSRADLEEAMRSDGGGGGGAREDVRAIYMESTGQISIERQETPTGESGAARA